MTDVLRKLDEEVGAMAVANALEYAPSRVRNNREHEEVYQNTPELSYVEELAVLCRLLTYGEMMEVAEGLVKNLLGGNTKAIVPEDEMSKAIYIWAKNYSKEE